MGFIVIYSLFSILWVMLDFNYFQQVIPSRVKKGEKVVLEIQIHNDKLFIFPYIKVFYQTPHSVIENRKRIYLFGTSLSTSSY